MRNALPARYASLPLTVAVVGACLGASLLGSPRATSASLNWWKGNLHTHSLWSDGDDFPEMITQWYRDHDYHFLAISDHNVLSEGERWIDPEDRLKGNPRALREYRYRLGDDWVQERTVAGKEQIRLRPLAEYRSMFEAPGRFLLIQSEEITDKLDKTPVHMNATNIQTLIPPQGGRTVREVMQNNVNAVWAQRRRTRKPMFPHLNHPNFGYAVTASDLAAVRGERFFEVYNGHPLCYNDGDASHPGTEAMWDSILAQRLSGPDPEPMWGMAVDDSHNYHTFDTTKSLPGRGWVMVRSEELKTESLIAALEAGDFYSSTGVTLREVRRERDRLTVEVEPSAGVDYRVRFIGTRRSPPGSGQPARVGAVFAESRGRTATYELRGDELYVRAVVLSSRRSVLPAVPGEVERAWTQPLIPALAP